MQMKPGQRHRALLRAEPRKHSALPLYPAPFPVMIVASVIAGERLGICCGLTRPQRGKADIHPVGGDSFPGRIASGERLPAVLFTLSRPPTVWGLIPHIPVPALLYPIESGAKDLNRTPISVLSRIAGAPARGRSCRCIRFGIKFHPRFSHPHLPLHHPRFLRN